MNASSKIDRKTIAWIKVEVEQTLNAIQDFPDKYLQNSADVDPIYACLEPLHRVTGALEIANIRGAVLLAREMEALIQALCNKKIKKHY